MGREAGKVGAVTSSRLALVEVSVTAMHLRPAWNLVSRQILFTATAESSRVCWSVQDFTAFAGCLLT